MKSYDSEYVYWVVTGVGGFVIGSLVKWASSKLKKIDETQMIKADFHNFKRDYQEFKAETKTELRKLDERTYNLKQ